ncbi:uncharacterized protein LOC144586787 [Pogona vitticeps]
MEARNIIQEAATKTIAKKRKCKKTKWLSNEALQIAEKRRERKCKGDRESYRKLNADFQRIARRDKRAFLNEQCQEIKNRKRKTRDLFKKIGEIKGTSHEKIDIIKDKNGRDLTEAEDIKNCWQEYTEELYQKDLDVMDNPDNVVADLEPDILESEVKWTLESMANNKVSGDDGSPTKLFKILKDDAVKVLHSMCQQVWKTQQWPEVWKRSVYIPIPKKGSAKNVPTTVQLHSFHMLARLCSKSYKVGFSSMWTKKSQKYKLDFEGAEELETKLLTCAGLWRKSESSRKTSTSASLTMQKPLTVWTTANYGKFLKKWECLTTLSIS